MPAAITFLQFAHIAEAVYDVAQRETPGGFARSGDRERWSGFTGAVFARPTDAGFDRVLAFAGSDFSTSEDVLTDAGFGGPLLAALGIGGAITAQYLANQVGTALGMARTMASTAGRGDRLYLCGHSLGGGLAQIVAAFTGIAAMAFNPPAVGALPGVREAFLVNAPDIVVLHVQNDPIHATSVLSVVTAGAPGSFAAPSGWLGRVLTLPSARTGREAHILPPTIAELSPSGPFSDWGARTPFAAAKRVGR